jgi:hypothetical protein
MDDATMLDLLWLAEKHVAMGAHNFNRQRETIDALRRIGRDTTQAEELLRIFEHVQAAHVADRDRLRRELEQAT